MLGNLFGRKNKGGKLTKPYYSIVSVKAGRVIDIAQSGNHRGTAIIYDGYNGDNQAFSIVPNGAAVNIKCRQGKGYLTVDSDKDGAKFRLSPQPTAQSAFRLEDIGGGKYLIYTFCGKVIDLFQGKKDNET
jgi:hypothetical protein